MSGKTIDFADMIDEMLNDENIIRKGEISIWGGKLTGKNGTTSESMLADFLGKWQESGMAYSIWEYSHDIEFKAFELPKTEDLPLLERGHVFGKNSGCLHIRRDWRDFSWSFIGPKATKLPEGITGFDFWETNDTQTLRWRKDQKAMLWGEYDHNSGRWHDDRVGWAKLNYPVKIKKTPKNNGTRLQIVYDLVMDGGQVAFVWWKEVTQYA